METSAFATCWLSDLTPPCCPSHPPHPVRPEGQGVCFEAAQATLLTPSPLRERLVNRSPKIRVPVRKKQVAKHLCHGVVKGLTPRCVQSHEDAITFSIPHPPSPPIGRPCSAVLFFPPRWAKFQKTPELSSSFRMVFPSRYSPEY